MKLAKTFIVPADDFSDRPIQSGSGPAICLFRHDLRVSDNPALQAACQSGREVLCLYTREENCGQRKAGGASDWWLHGSLSSFAKSLEGLNAHLWIVRGDPLQLVPEICAQFGASAVFWNRRYALTEREADAALKLRLKENGISAASFNGHLLYEPWEVKTQAGGPMRVFTPFWRAARAVRTPVPPIQAPTHVNGFKIQIASSLPGYTILDDLDLLPTKPDWAGGLREEWKPGEAGAKARLLEFLDGPIRGYGEDRNLPGHRSTSKLSPYLKFGDISVRQIWASVQNMLDSGQLDGYEEDVSKFLAELGWREFSYNLLFHFPTIGHANYQERFNSFPWLDDEAGLKAWQRGQTGYPLVDAGMRELWQTGWMHNRVRMVVASFLIKHLLIDWRHGEEWFWDTLCDSDPGSNAASWQWVAGSGADAAPYYRIFNPFGQGEKFDKEAKYVRRFVPELAKMPDQFIHRPWEAPPHVLANAGVSLGKTYPAPIVDHAFARERALAALKSISADAA